MLKINKSRSYTQRTAINHNLLTFEQLSSSTRIHLACAFRKRFCYSRRQKWPRTITSKNLQNCTGIYLACAQKEILLQLKTEVAAYMNNIQKSVELCWYIRDGAFISAFTFHKHPHFPPENYCESQFYAFSLFPQEHSYKLY